MRRGQPKNRNVALALAIVLGGVGAHRFYLGERRAGLLYLAFCWTGIPGIVGLVDALDIRARVDRYNARRDADRAKVQ